VFLVIIEMRWLLRQWPEHWILDIGVGLLGGIPRGGGCLMLHGWVDGDWQNRGAFGDGR